MNEEFYSAYCSRKGSKNVESEGINEILRRGSKNKENSEGILKHSTRKLKEKVYKLRISFGSHAMRFI